MSFRIAAIAIAGGGGGGGSTIAVARTFRISHDDINPPITVVILSFIIMIVTAFMYENHDSAVYS